MSDLSDRPDLRRMLLNRVVTYGRKLGDLGRRVRQLVFGFRLRSTIAIDRGSLPVKLIQDHRLLQRRQAFLRGGGTESGVARYALRKARRR